MQRVGRRSIGETSRKRLSSLGSNVRVLASAFTIESFRDWRTSEFKFHLRWMGEGSLPLITWSAVFISLALSTQAILELRKYGAEDLAGPLIAIALLRELGPLTVSLAWGARAAAFISADGRHRAEEDGQRESTHSFLPLYAAAIFSGTLLSVYGLVIGFTAAAVFSPTLGVTSMSDFMESARAHIENKDVFIYFFKLVLVNPTIGVIAGFIAARRDDLSPGFAAAEAVTGTFIFGGLLNLAVTLLAYYP